MYIRPISDLHLEFGNPFRPPEMETDPETVLVLAGDIHVKTKAAEWIQALADRFLHVIYVCGNHEFYRDNLTYLPAKLKKIFAGGQKISFLEKESVEINGVRFLGTTLWTDFHREDPNIMLHAPRHMIDYDLIRMGPSYRRITPATILEEHRRSRRFLEEKLAQEFPGPTVIVTHHGPSYQSVHEIYRGSSGNDFYVSDLEDLVFGYQPKYWIHGHTHESLDYQLGKTRVVVNPFGYHNHQVNGRFQPHLLLEI